MADINIPDSSLKTNSNSKPALHTHATLQKPQEEASETTNKTKVIISNSQGKRNATSIATDATSTSTASKLHSLDFEEGINEDSDLDPDYIPEPSEKKSQTSFKRGENLDPASRRRKQDSPKQKSFKRQKADTDFESELEEDGGESDVSETDIDAFLETLEKQKALSLNQDIKELLEGCKQDRNGEEEDGTASPPKKWEHFIIPLEGALKHLPEKPFKNMWFKLYEDPGFEVSTNGECLLYNEAKPTFYMKHPNSNKHCTPSAQKVVLMLACGCYDLPLELSTATVCFNYRCITVDHISLEPRWLQGFRMQCLSRGKCTRHYDPDAHEYYADCRPDLFVSRIDCDADEISER